MNRDGSGGGSALLLAGAIPQVLPVSRAEAAACQESLVCQDMTEDEGSTFDACDRLRRYHARPTRASC